MMTRNSILTVLTQQSVYQLKNQRIVSQNIVG